MDKPLRLPQVTEYDVEDAKALLRKIIREHRRSRTKQSLEAHARSLVTTGLQAVGNARTVAMYVSTEKEPSTRPLLDALHARGVAVLLPVLGPGLGRNWALYQGPQDLAERAPGRPPEPSGPVLDAAEVARVGVIITPGLAIDGAGNRLGQGGGWYDRMLAMVDPATPVFSMVFDDELITNLTLPTDQHDKTVPAVITPSQVFLIEGSPFQSKWRKSVGADAR